MGHPKEDYLKSVDQAPAPVEEVDVEEGVEEVEEE